jgi:hypothetical protein
MNWAIGAGSYPAKPWDQNNNNIYLLSTTVTYDQFYKLGGFSGHDVTGDDDPFDDTTGDDDLGGDGDWNGNSEAGSDKNVDDIGDDAKLAICKAKFPKESPLSLRISAVQDFSDNPTLERTITSPMNPDFSFTITSNKNYLAFYETYPSSYTDNNFMTRWAMYANTPLEKGITAQLYPKMKEKLEGMTPLEKVQQLDWWVQGTVDIKRENPNQGCFLYAFDDDVWGGDRAFFGEETFFYPYCDCEDRSILLSHLVRDLVDLDVVLVYYPGHLAMAVNFPEDIPGDHIMLDGRKFTVCDPTYVGSEVGETMPTMKDKSTTVILLERNS